MTKIITTSTLLALILLLNSCCGFMRKERAECAVGLNGNEDYFTEYSNGMEVNQDIPFTCIENNQRESVIWIVDEKDTLIGSSNTMQFSEPGTYDYTVRYINSCEKIITKDGSFTIYDFNRKALLGKWKLNRVKSKCSVNGDTLDGICNNSNFDTLALNSYLEFEQKQITRTEGTKITQHEWNLNDPIALNSYFNFDEIYGDISVLTDSTFAVETSYTTSDGQYSYKLWEFIK